MTNFPVREFLVTACCTLLSLACLSQGQDGLTIERNAASQVVLKFTGQLLASPAVGTPFLPQIGAQSPYIEISGNAGRFYGSASRLSGAQIFGLGPNGLTAYYFDRGSSEWKPLPGELDNLQRPDLVLPQEPYYGTLLSADLDGDGNAELITRSINGIAAWRYDRNLAAWQRLPGLIAELSDANRGDRPEYYSTIRVGRIVPGNTSQVIARLSDGIHLWSYNMEDKSWHALPGVISMTDASGWIYHLYYSTIQLADIDGDGVQELYARDSSGVNGYRYDNQNGQWVSINGTLTLNDSSGWSFPQYYSTIHFADIDGDGRDDVFARAGNGVNFWKYDLTAQNWIAIPNVKILDLSDQNGFAVAQYYRTIQSIRTGWGFGRGKSSILVRSSGGIRVWELQSDGQWVNSSSQITAVSDANGGSDASVYETIRAVDFTGDGRDEIMCRTRNGVFVYQRVGSEWLRFGNGLTSFNDASAWNKSPYYLAIRAGELSQAHD